MKWEKKRREENEARWTKKTVAAVREGKSDREGHLATNGRWKREKTHTGWTPSPTCLRFVPPAHSWIQTLFGHFPFMTFVVVYVATRRFEAAGGDFRIRIGSSSTWFNSN